MRHVGCVGWCYIHFNGCTIMTSNVPNIEKGGKYNMSQACEALGVCRATLNKYVEMKHLPCRHSEGNGRKIFKGEDLLRFWWTH